MTTTSKNKKIMVCDIRNDEGLRFRKDKEILPCITEHIHKDGGVNIHVLLWRFMKTKKIEVCDFRYDEGLRSRKDKQIMPTVTTFGGGGGLSGKPMVKEIEVCDYRYDEGFRVRKNGCCPTIKRRAEGQDIANTPMAIEKQIRIRKLTSLECYRLMGFDDEDHRQASEVNSDSQLYKQAGNSIVVDVLEAIFREML